MLVRHDAQIKVTTRYPDGIVDKDIMTPTQLEGHRLVLGALYNVSGYYNPFKPTIKITVPKEAVLKNGQLCDCKECVGE